MPSLAHTACVGEHPRRSGLCSQSLVLTHRSGSVPTLIYKSELSPHVPPPLPLDTPVQSPSAPMPGSAGFEEGLECLGPRSRRTRAALCTGSAPSRVVLIPLSTGQMCFEIYTTDSLVPHVFELKQPIQAFQSRGSLLALGSTIPGLCTQGAPQRGHSFNKYVLSTYYMLVPS